MWLRGGKGPRYEDALVNFLLFVWFTSDFKNLRVCACGAAAASSGSRGNQRNHPGFHIAEDPANLRSLVPCGRYNPTAPLDGGGAGQLQSGLDLTEGPGWGGGGRRGQRMRKRGRQGWGCPGILLLLQGQALISKGRGGVRHARGKGQARLGEGLWAQSPVASPWSPRV